LCVFKNTEIRVVAVVGIPCDVIACIWQVLPDEINYPLRFSASLKALVAAALPCAGVRSDQIASAGRSANV